MGAAGATASCSALDFQTLGCAAQRSPEVRPSGQGADVGAGSCESGQWGSGGCASPQPLCSTIRREEERSALSRDIRGEGKKDAGIKW